MSQVITLPTDVNSNQTQQSKSAVRSSPGKSQMPDFGADEPPHPADNPHNENGKKMDKPKKGRPKSGPKGASDELTPWEIENGLINFMTGGANIPRCLNKVSFPDKYRCWERNHERCAIDLIEVKENGLVSSIDEKALRRELSDSMRGFFGADQWRLPAAEVAKIVKAYTLLSHPHFLKGDKIPVPFKFAHEHDKLAFNIIPTPAILEHFYPHPEFVRLAPIYSEIMSRNQYPDIKRQFYGSQLFPGMPRKKMPWDCGLANAGKTSTNIALGRSIFGDAGLAVITLDDMIDNKNLMYDLRDKMLVIVDDVPADFFKHNVAKTMTGVAKKQIEGKFKDAYSSDLNFRVLMTSQFQPKWTGDSGQEARVVVNEMAPIKGEIMSVTELELALRPELPYIIADIMHAYLPIYGKDISTPVGNLDAAKEAADEGRQLAFDDHFISPTPAELSDPFFQICEVLSRNFDDAFKFNRGDTSIEEMRKFVKRKYNSIIGHKHRHKRWVTNIRPLM